MRGHVIRALKAWAVTGWQGDAWRRGATRSGLRGMMALALLCAGQVSATQAAAPNGPQRGGTLIYGTTQNIDSFIPVLSPTSILDDEAQVLLYRPLLWIGQHVSIDYSRSIATSITVGAHNTVYTVHMRGDYKWSDGTAVTASDVQFCFNLIKAYGQKYGYYGIGGLPTLVTSFAVRSPTSFRITLSKPLNPTYFELNGLAQLRPLPYKAWKTYSIPYLFNNQTNLHVLSVVDGPYTLTKFVLNQYARFDRNPLYSGHQSYLDTFIMQYFASEQAEFAALKTGAIQIGFLGYTLYNAAGQLSSLKTYDWSIFGFNYIVLNYRNPALPFMKDMKVRQALQLAINQPEMNQALYYGHAHSAYSPVPYAPQTYLSPQARATMNASIHYNPARARALLAADGWKMTGSVLTKNGQKLAFGLTVGSESQTSVRQAEIIQQDFAALGVQVKLNSIPFSTILAELGGRGTNWDAISIGWIYYPNFYPLGDGLFGSAGGANFGGFSDPILDQAISRAQTTPGFSSIYQYENYAAAAVPALYLDDPETIIKYQPSVHGIADFFNPVYANSPEYLWIAK